MRVRSSVRSLLSGYGGSGGDEAKPASSPSVSKESIDPKSSDPEPSVEYPAAPEGDIDRLADEKGWVVDDLYPAASDFVADICESLPVSAADSSSRPQWLAESGKSSKPAAADEDEETIPPGTYRARGSMKDCY